MRRSGASGTGPIPVDLGTTRSRPRHRARRGGQSSPRWGRRSDGDRHHPRARERGAHCAANNDPNNCKGSAHAVQQVPGAGQRDRDLHRRHDVRLCLRPRRASLRERLRAEQRPEQLRLSLRHELPRRPDEGQRRDDLRRQRLRARLRYGPDQVQGASTSTRRPARQLRRVRQPVRGPDRRAAAVSACATPRAAGRLLRPPGCRRLDRRRAGRTGRMRRGLSHHPPRGAAPGPGWSGTRTERVPVDRAVRTRGRHVLELPRHGIGSAATAPRRSTNRRTSASATPVACTRRPRSPSSSSPPPTPATASSAISSPSPTAARTRWVPQRSRGSPDLMLQLLPGSATRSSPPVPGPGARSHRRRRQRRGRPGGRQLAEHGRHRRIASVDASSYLGTDPGDANRHVHGRDRRGLVFNTVLSSTSIANVKSYLATRCDERPGAGDQENPQGRREGGKGSRFNSHRLITSILNRISSASRGALALWARSFSSSAAPTPNVIARPWPVDLDAKLVVAVAIHAPRLVRFDDRDRPVRLVVADQIAALPLDRNVEDVMVPSATPKEPVAKPALDLDEVRVAFVVRCGGVLSRRRRRVLHGPRRRSPAARHERVIIPCPASPVTLTLCQHSRSPAVAFGNEGRVLFVNSGVSVAGSWISPMSSYESGSAGGAARGERRMLGERPPRLAAEVGRRPPAPRGALQGRRTLPPHAASARD